MYFIGVDLITKLAPARHERVEIGRKAQESRRRSASFCCHSKLDNSVFDHSD